MAEENKSYFMIIAIVAIVAIVALVIMVSGKNKATTGTIVVGNDDVSGQALATGKPIYELVYFQIHWPGDLNIHSSNCNHHIDGSMYGSAGLDPSTKGDIGYYDQTLGTDVIRYDECQDQDTLTEWYCSDEGHAVSIQVTCFVMCGNGHCLKPEIYKGANTER